MNKRTRLLLLCAIVLLAAFLRLYRIDALPPSAGYDQAGYGLDAIDILNGARPIFLPTNFGREALYSYCVALFLWLLGNPVIAVYAASAAIGVLAVPAVYWAAQELFADQEGTLSRYSGLVAALALAIMYPHLSWSRLGMRAILVPLWASLAAALQWRGLRTGRLWAFAGCGLALGLGLHSYQAARALPFLVLLGFVYAWWAKQSVTWKDIGGLALVAAVALLVFSPLGLYFLRHPGSSGLRISQTMVVSGEQGLASNASRLWAKLVEALRVYALSGDADARVNPAGHAALDPFLLLPAAAGLAIALAHLRRPPTLYLLTWLCGLAAPALLADQGAVTKRSLGAAPAIALLIALGCLTLWDWGRSRIRRLAPAPRRALEVALALLLAAGFTASGARTARDYFHVWGADPELFTHFESGQSAVGAYIRELPPTEEIYLSPIPADHLSVRLNAYPRTRFKGYQGRFCQVLPERAAAGASYLIAPHDDRWSLERLRDAYPQGEIAHQGPRHHGEPYFVAYRIPAGAAAQIAPQHLAAGRWEDKARLLGYDLDRPAYAPGGSIQLTLYVQALGEMETDYTLFAQLLGPDNRATGGPLWAGSDSEPCKRGYPTSVWQAGEVIVDGYTLPIPADAPAAAYRLIVGFYNWTTMVRLPVVDAQGQPVADHVVLGEVAIP